MELDKTQLQWLLAGIGAVVVILIYLWGIRSHLKRSAATAGIGFQGAGAGRHERHRRRRRGRRYVLMSWAASPKHPWPTRCWVDVEIRPSIARAPLR